MFEKPAASGVSMNLGDANAISGGLHVSDSHDVHNIQNTSNTTIDNRSSVDNGNNPKIQKLLEEVEMESAKAEKVAKANACKNTFVKILTYNWKITAAVILAVLIGIFMLFHKSDEAKIENLLEEVSELVDDGNLDKANKKLVNTTILKGISKQGAYNIVKYYDPIYLKVIKAYINQGNYEAAEELALSYRGKIGDDISWAESPTYIYLRSLYEKEGRDFSALISKDDFISR